MSVETSSEKHKQIRNLLLVVGSGVVSALALALVMLVLYNPTGRYYAKKVLLSPEIMSQISYPETNPKTGVIARYMFDSFVFAYYEPTKKEWFRTVVGQEAYREFFTAVAEDLSIQPVSDQLRNLFNQNHPTTLTVHMRQERGAQPDEKITFQQVDFAPGKDFYRVQLRTQGSEAQDEAQGESWAYFFHPGIERYARAVFYP